MLVLGISCCFSDSENEFIPGLPQWFGHDAAAVLIRDGEVIAGIEEERLNRIKHTNRFASKAILACLSQANVKLQDVDYIAYFFEEDDNDKELNLLYAQEIDTPLRYSRALITDKLNLLVGEKAVIPDQIRFVHHHTAHAYAAFFHSGFEEALVGIFDGSGERESVSLYRASKGHIETLRTFPPLKSLGHLYSASIELLAYRMFDEYKVMGLAPYGDPARYRDWFRSCYDLTEDGGYELEYSKVRSYFLLKGFKPRRRSEPISQVHCDFAAGLQEMLETIAAHILRAAQRHTGLQRLCLSGGVALNCSMNGRLLREGIFEDLFVHPASHDAGAAVGAAMYVCNEAAPSKLTSRRITDVYWGLAAGTKREIEETCGLWSRYLSLRRCDDVCTETAKLIAGGAVVAWVQGRSEFGPRALGNRSILADPRPVENRLRINDAIKNREDYRPFAPSVLSEAAETYFEIPAGAPPLDFMIIVVKVRPEYRDVLGAVTHIDGTARIQVVRQSANPQYWSLINQFSQLTEIPVLLNTSFNSNMEPIVQDVHDAIRSYLTTQIEYLIVDDFVIEKKPVEWKAYTTLTPTLNEAARLRDTSRVGARQCSTYEIYLNYTGGAKLEISQKMYSVLCQVDGRTTLEGLGVGEEELVSQFRKLWQHRMIDLRP